MNVAYLADFPHHAETIAGWVFDAWGYLRPELTLAGARAEFEARAVKDRIPLALIAVDGEEVVGCLNIKEHEDMTRSGLSPWLGAVYVREDQRGRGIGLRLVRAAEDVARALGVSALYLSATEAESFYARQGWTVLERCLSQGEAVAVMVKCLGGVTVRGAEAVDIPALLKINAQSTPGVSALDEQALKGVRAVASYVQVALVGDQVVGYIIGYRHDVPYDGEEYGWFRRHYPTFLYVDQVAVLGSLRRCGIGAHLYRAAEQWALAHGIPMLTCEVNLDPPNPGSLRFHRREGYLPVQALDTQDGRKVSLMVKALP